jgi:hypothetical protein
MGKPFAQKARSVSFQHVRHQGRTETRRGTHKDMDVVDVGFYCEERQALFFATFGNQPLRLNLDFAGENTPPVLGNPYEMRGY